MNAKQRQAIAERLAAIAQASGATVTITNDSRYRSHMVEADFPDVSVSMDIDDLHRGGIMAHWYGAKRPLVVMPFDSINECHRTKATQYRNNAEDFAAAFERACVCVADGSAFA